ncbi:CHASE2 domain-containing serine/threonine-protein kinase [Myxococcota bacterium]
MRFVSGKSLLVAAIAAAGAALTGIGLWEGLELDTLDLRYRVAGSRPLHESIRLVAVDNATVAKFGWPLPRNVQAQLLAIFGQAQARAIGYDILFLDEDPGDLRNDLAFGTVASEHPCVIFPTMLEVEGEGYASTTPSCTDRAFGSVPFAAPISASGWSGPIPELARATTMPAHTYLTADADGVVRRVPVLIDVQDRSFPALALAVYLCATKSEGPKEIELESQSTLAVKADDQVIRRLQVDERGVSGILMRARLEEVVIESVLNILSEFKDARERQDVESVLSRYRGRIVLVGQTASAVGDYGPMALGPRAPFLLVHANFLDNLVSDELLTRLPRFWNAMIVAILSLLVGSFCARGRSSWHVAATVLVVIYGAAALVLFAASGIWIDVFGPTVMAVVAGLVVVGSTRVGQKPGDMVRRPGSTRTLAQSHAVEPSDRSPSLPGPGTVLGQQYQIEDFLGEGAHSTVYRAKDLKLERLVAVKILSKVGLTGDENGSKFKQRFRQEAVQAANVAHPAIASIFNYGSDNDVFWYAMEYVPNSRTLGNRIREAAATRDFIPLPDIQQYFSQAAAGLGAIHERNVIHRDIKPENLLVFDTTEGSRLKILDFGVCHVFESNLTQAGLGVGTPAYFAPEYVDWICGAKVTLDGRMDLFALGVTLYQVLTGKLPFEAPDFRSVFDKIRTHTPPHPSETREDLPLGWNRITMTLLEKKPRHRYANASSLFEDLSRADSLGDYVSLTEQTTKPKGISG